MKEIYYIHVINELFLSHPFLVTGAGCIRIPILEKKTSFEVFFRK